MRHPTFTWPSTPIIPPPESLFYGSPETGTGCVDSWANHEIVAELRLYARNGDPHQKRYARASLALLPVLDQVKGVPVGDDAAAAEAIRKGTLQENFAQGGAGGRTAVNADGEPAHPVQPGHNEFAVAWPESVTLETLIDAKRAWVQQNFNRGYDGTQTGVGVDKGL